MRETQNILIAVGRRFESFTSRSRIFAKLISTVSYLT